MTKKARRNANFVVPINPILNEGPPLTDPRNVRIVKRELRRLEHRIIERDGDISALRQVLNSTTVEELWEVPG